MKIFETKYRILYRDYGFRSEYKRWWWPFWRGCFGLNINTNIKEAIKCCNRHHTNHTGGIKYNPQTRELGRGDK